MFYESVISNKMKVEVILLERIIGKKSALRHLKGLELADSLVVLA